MERVRHRSGGRDDRRRRSRVTVSRNGFAIIGIGIIRNREIERVLNERLSHTPYKRIVVEADRRVSYGALQPIFRVAQTHGLPVVFVSGTVSVLDQSEAELRFDKTTTAQADRHEPANRK